MDESDFSEGSEEGDEPQEEILDPDNPAHEFPILERNFNKIITEIEQNPDASQFAEEFNKLFEKLFQVHEAHKNLEQNYETLQQELGDRSNKLEIATKLSEIDAGTIKDLKHQIDHTWKLADAAHAREQTAQEIIENLRKQIEHLNTEIEFRNRMGQETTEECSS